MRTCRSDKTFQGDLAGVSKSETITAAGIAVKESAACSAVKRVTGVMDRGKSSWNITVVPDSATSELTGLTGKMGIIIEGKEHKYVFEHLRPKE